jgi:hypothetical protein
VLPPVWQWETPVTTANVYRVYAQEAVESARHATNDEFRKQFLDIAKLWLVAASKLDGGHINLESEMGPKTATPTNSHSGVVRDDRSS